MLMTVMRIAVEAIEAAKNSNKATMINTNNNKKKAGGAEDKERKRKGRE